MGLGDWWATVGPFSCDRPRQIDDRIEEGMEDVAHVRRYVTGMAGGCGFLHSSISVDKCVVATE